jgi:MFS family permease
VLESPIAEPRDPSIPSSEWTVQDIPRAVRLAFDIQKLAVATVGLTAAAITYAAFWWLGNLTGERSGHRVFMVLGAMLATCLCVLCSGIIARMATVQLLEQRRASAAELRQFARDRASTLLGIPLTFGGIAVGVFAIEAMLALAGSIPGIGPIIYSACFLLAFFLSLTAVLTVSVHMVGAFLYPSIVSIRGVGAVGAVVEVVELARRQPLFLLLCEAVVALVGALMTLLIGGAVWASLSLTTWLAEAIMDERFELSVGSIPSFFEVFLRPFAKVFPLSPELLEATWNYDLAGLLMGISFMIVAVLTLVYPFTFFTSAGSITYLILRSEPLDPERSLIEDL